ncbi:MAG: reverse transcriptase family protein, partial [Saprospiraceae bacterium]|nr:reverse transcriptase family protein [Saprospiraceae bacterium]
YLLKLFIMNSNYISTTNRPYWNRRKRLPELSHIDQIIKTMPMKQNEFLNLIQSNAEEWEDALQNNTYYTFKIPKSNGKYRTIEAPSQPLKKVQRKIARYLQSNYHETLPPCVHGYILKDPIRMISRDIRTNALTHIGKSYLLNVDLKDFFYQVDIEGFKQNLKEDGLSKSTREDVATLCFKKQRLPMGAPTSPVISNMAFLQADFSLMALAQAQQLTYSRYVDDLSFSSNMEITPEVYHQIETCITQHGFLINKKKVKWYGKQSEKLITGIVLQ